MEPVETMSVDNSEEGGNGLPPAAPSEPTAEPVAPAVAEPVTTTESATPELFELPDGRKVDAATLNKEFKENFLPEFTRKSQELAQLKTGIPAPLTEPKPADPLADPNYIPQTYDELADQLEARFEAKQQAREKAILEGRQAIESAVESQLTELKTSDPTLNENALFLHATKYRFTDLRVAHQNMKDMGEMAKIVQKTTAANIAKRADPVSVSHGATGAKPDPSHFAHARDYVRSLQT